MTLRSLFTGIFYDGFHVAKARGEAPEYLMALTFLGVGIGMLSLGIASAIFTVILVAFASVIDVGLTSAIILGGMFGLSVIVVISVQLNFVAEKVVRPWVIVAVPAMRGPGATRSLVVDSAMGMVVGVCIGSGMVVASMLSFAFFSGIG